jgi:hypothetical protein
MLCLVPRRFGLFTSLSAAAHAKAAQAIEQHIAPGYEAGYAPTGELSKNIMHKLYNGQMGLITHSVYFARKSEIKVLLISHPIFIQIEPKFN